MAYIKRNKDQEKGADGEKLSEAPGAREAGSEMTSGEAPASQTRFVNLSELLGMNAARGQRMAADIANRVEQRGQGVEANLQDAIQNWRGQLRHTDEGSRTLEQDMGSDEVQRLTQESDEVAAMADAANTQEGRDALVGHFNPRTTSGGRRLDAALLGGQGASQELGRVQRFSGIRNALGQTRSQAVSEQGAKDAEIGGFRAAAAAEQQRLAAERAERNRQMQEREQARRTEEARVGNENRQRDSGRWSQEDSTDYFERRRRGRANREELD
jgi:hypothetical protein